MAGAGFKFEFSPPTSGGVALSSESANHQTPVAQSGNLTQKANEYILNLIEKSKRIADKKCVLLNASSEPVIATSGASEKGNDSGKSALNELTSSSSCQPQQEFHHDHQYELVDLQSINLEPLKYVIPTHKMSVKNTDLIPGVYEGGLKVWECSVDLCRFLANIIDEILERRTSIRAKNLDALRAAVRRSVEPGGSTLELGCGHGLPGCLILRENIRKALLSKNGEGTGCSNSENNYGEIVPSNGSAVLFSDFNDYVLHHATIPNARMNVLSLEQEEGGRGKETLSKMILERAIFSGGDWMVLSDKLSNSPFGTGNLHNKLLDRFDLILAAETTYTEESCKDTAFLMFRHLKVDAGIGLVATKRFYFGVGGGTDMFSKAIEMLNSNTLERYSGLRLILRTIQSHDTGNANIRDLLEVKLCRV